MKQAGRVAAALALLFVAVVHVFAVVRLAQRKGVDGDEGEFLHAALRMAAGERIYVNFFEHHPPFIPLVLKWIAPRVVSPSSIDAYVFRAHLLAGALGTLALAAAAFIVWRAAGRLYAPVIFLGVLLASPTLWTRAFVQVRSEAPALAAFWCGALLILAAGSTPSRRVTLGAIGIGLVTLSCLINPKWPIASAVLGLFFLAGAAQEGRRSFIRGCLLGTAAAGCAVLLLAAVVPPHRYFDFVFVFSRHLYGWWRTHQSLSGNDAIAFFHCPRRLRPEYVLPLAAIVAVGCFAIRGAFERVRIVSAFMALLIAAFLEIRFVDPWPTLWVHYYSLFGMAGACVYACVPEAVVAIVKRVAPNALPFSRAVPVVLTFLAVVNAPGVIPVKSHANPNAVAMEGLAAQLHPGDTVFLVAACHPVGARDAGYYWFGFIDVLPAALEFAKTPAGRFLPAMTEENLPPCRVERGLDPHLRLISGGDDIATMKVLSGCMARLRERGVLVPTYVRNVFLVRRDGVAALQ